jgi:hypothetical protein
MSKKEKPVEPEKSSVDLAALAQFLVGLEKTGLIRIRRERLRI